MSASGPTGREARQESYRRAAESVRARILRACEASGRAANEVGLVVVTKTREPDEVRSFLGAAMDVGLPILALGENRVQEALRKQAQLGDLQGPRWDLVGTLQANKVRHVAGHFSLFHAFDRPELVAPFARRSRDVPVLLQVNMSGESTKAGVAPGEAGRLLDACLDAGIQVRGLMTIPAPGDMAGAERCFEALASLRDRLAKRAGGTLPELSMGMSDDFEAAIRCGATLIRLGRVLLGERN